MTPNLEQLEQAVAETPVSQIPALIGILAQLQAKAQLKMLSEQKTASDRDGGLLTMRQAAARLNVPESRAYELARQGKLPAVRIGKYVRISAEAWNAVRRHIFEGVFREARDTNAKGFVGEIISGQKLERQLKRLGPESVNELLASADREFQARHYTEAGSYYE